MPGDDRQPLVAALRRMFPVDVPRFDRPHWRTHEVRDLGEEVVLVGRFDQDPNRYGIPIDITRRSHEFYYTDFAVADDDEWLESVDIGLMVMLDTGFRAGARRRRVGDYIELRSEDGWPVDERFYPQDATHDDEELQALIAQTLRRDGLDPAVGIARRRQGRLLAWLLEYENTAPSGPWVGQAVVASDGAGEAILEVAEIGPRVPESVRVDVAYFACHDAAEAGALAVSTSLTEGSLSLVGFREDEAGRRVLQTHFLDADPKGARELYRADVGGGKKWGNR